MTGVLISILATWAMLYFTNHWLLSIVTGFIAWFVSAVIIFEAVEFITRLRRKTWLEDRKIRQSIIKYLMK